MFLRKNRWRRNHPRQPGCSVFYYPGHTVDALLHAADELRPEEHGVHIRQVRAVLDFFGGIAVVHGHHQRAGLEDAEVDRQPLQAVHQKDRDLVALDNTAGDEKVSDAVCLFFKDTPGDLRAERNFIQRLDQFKFLPCSQLWSLNLRIEFHKRYVIGILTGVFFQKICD